MSEIIQRHHIAAIERAIQWNEQQADVLSADGDYNTEFPTEDAKALREVIAMLAARSGKGEDNEV